MFLVRLKTVALMTLTFLFAGGSALFGAGLWQSNAAPRPEPRREQPVRVVEEPPAPTHFLEHAVLTARSIETKDDDEIGRKINILVNIARSQAKLGDKPTAGKTLTIARDLVKDMKTEHAKVSSLGSIGTTEAEFDDIKAARTTGAALKECKRPESEYLMAVNFNAIQTEIAVAQVRAGDYKAALQTVEEVYESKRAGSRGKPEVVKRIALELAKRKQAKEAKETAARIKPEVERIDLLMQIAAALDTAGDRTTAAEIYHDVLAAVGKLVKENADTSAINVYMLALGLGEHGEEESVLRWLRSQKSPEIKTMMLMGLAQGAVKRNATKGDGKQ